jgi:hypothetical protein
MVGARCLKRALSYRIQRVVRTLYARCILYEYNAPGDVLVFLSR